jgi:hypothetical protein
MTRPALHSVILRLTAMALLIALACTIAVTAVSVVLFGIQLWIGLR